MFNSSFKNQEIYSHKFIFYMLIRNFPQELMKHSILDLATLRLRGLTPFEMTTLRHSFGVLF
jgi:hypothetical protein